MTWSLATITAIKIGSGRRRQTNVPPLRAISMTMAVRRCDTECISRFSTNSTSLEATECHHRVTLHIAPAATRATIITMIMQNVPTLLAVSMAIAMRQYYTPHIAQWRRFVAFIKATKRHHRVSTCSDRHQSDMPTPISGVCFIVKSLKKISSCPNNNRGVTHQTDDKHKNNMSEYYVGVVNIAFNRITIIFYDVSLTKIFINRTSKNS